MERIDFKTGTFYQGDCFEVLETLPAGSVDMILNDPPYGTTACAWDSILPLPDMWAAYWRVLKANGPAVLTAAQPFTSALVMSAPDVFRYLWLWDKISVTGFANAKKQPLRHVEDVAVFYRSLPTYNAQGLQPFNKVRKNSATDGGATVKGEHLSNGRGSLRTAGLEREQEFTNWPRQLLQIGRERGFHPTQKPVALFEYLIKTYTDPGEIVLDPTAGSGTAAVAAIQSGRRWVCVERDPEYFFKACARVYEAEAALARQAS